MIHQSEAALAPYSALLINSKKVAYAFDSSSTQLQKRPKVVLCSPLVVLNDTLMSLFVKMPDLVQKLVKD